MFLSIFFVQQIPPGIFGRCVAIKKKDIVCGLTKNNSNIKPFFGNNVGGKKVKCHFLWLWENSISSEDLSKKEYTEGGLRQSKPFVGSVIYPIPFSVVMFT